jgi:hypothetical protein
VPQVQSDAPRGCVFVAGVSCSQNFRSGRFFLQNAKLFARTFSIEHACTYFPRLTWGENGRRFAPSKPAAQRTTGVSHESSIRSFIAFFVSGVGAGGSRSGSGAAGGTNSSTSGAGESHHEHANGDVVRAYSQERRLVRADRVRIESALRVGRSESREALQRESGGDHRNHGRREHRSRATHRSSLLIDFTAKVNEGGKPGMLRASRFLFLNCFWASPKVFSHQVFCLAMVAEIRAENRSR